MQPGTSGRAAGDVLHDRRVEEPLPHANYYATPELAAHYDRDNADRADLAFYLRLVRDLSAAHVIDVGCGTGLLCSRLAAQGHRVVGVDPELTMLDIAATQPHAAAVRWIHGTADDLPTGWADLAVMTGHVAQYFLSDADWHHVLAQTHRALRVPGHVAFEVRNPAVEEWRGWPTEEPRPTAAGTLETVVDVRGDLVTHTDRWGQDGQTWTTSETLRFPSWDAVTAGLAAAEFCVVDSWGDFAGRPRGPASPEWIVLARR